MALNNALLAINICHCYTRVTLHRLTAEAGGKGHSSRSSAGNGGCERGGALVCILFAAYSSLH